MSTNRFFSNFSRNIIKLHSQFDLKKHAVCYQNKMSLFNSWLQILFCLVFICLHKQSRKPFVTVVFSESNWSNITMWHSNVYLRASLDTVHLFNSPSWSTWRTNRLSKSSQEVGEKSCIFLISISSHCSEGLLNFSSLTRAKFGFSKSIFNNKELYLLQQCARLFILHWRTKRAVLTWFSEFSNFT